MTGKSAIHILQESQASPVSQGTLSPHTQQVLHSQSILQDKTLQCTFECGLCIKCIHFVYVCVCGYTIYVALIYSLCQNPSTLFPHVRQNILGVTKAIMWLHILNLLTCSVQTNHEIVRLVGSDMKIEIG